MSKYKAVFLGGTNHGVLKRYEEKPPRKIALIDNKKTSWEDLSKTSAAEEYELAKKIEYHGSDEIILIYTEDYAWYSTTIIEGLVELARKNGAFAVMPE